MSLDIFDLGSLNLSSRISNRSPQAILVNETKVTQSHQKSVCRSSCCSTRGSMASLEHWDVGLIPSQCVKDLVLPQLQCRSQETWI